MTYDVTCTAIYNGNFSVEANSEREAMELAKKELNHGTTHKDFCCGGVNFYLGEITADYAEEVD